jgi:hypothetical protein
MDSRLCSHRRVQNHLELSVTHSSELAAVDDRTVTNAGGERISQDAFLVRQRTRTDSRNALIPSRRRQIFSIDQSWPNSFFMCAMLQPRVRLVEAT